MNLQQKAIAYTSRHKLASSVNLYRFTHFLDFTSGAIFANLLVGEASPIPFERHLRYRLLVHSERSIQKEKPGLLKSVQVKIFHFWYSVFLFNPANEGTDLLQIFLSHRSHLLTQFTIWSVSIIHRSEKLCRRHIEI